MKKVLSLILVMVLMIITLTGCVNIDYAVKVNKDGSGDITYIYAIEKEQLDSLGISADEAMSEMKKEVQDSEYTVEAYETDTEIGFKALKHIENVTADLSLEEAFGEEYIKDSEENVIKIEKISGKTKYSQKASIDLTSMEDLAYIGIKMKYSITLPTKINAENTNGTISEDGKTVTWDLIIGEINNIEFEAVAGNNLVWIIGGVVLGILLITVIIVIVIKKTGKNKEKIENSTESPIEEDK